MKHQPVTDQFAAPGSVPGLYLRPERRSRAQFEPVRLAAKDDFDQARRVIDRELGRLFTAHGEANVDWYVGCSLGLDVRRSVAWCNSDLTDRVVL